MRNLKKKLSVAASAVALSGAVVMTGASNAQAAALGCAYPYACVYDFNRNLIEDYREVTSGWQSLPNSNVWHAVNSRNDDVVYIRHTDGLVACLPAGHPERVYRLYNHVPNGIRIDSSSSCGSTLVPEYFVP
ncbi:hypothetical protein K4B79_20185 [Streptomyces lincolnensis]|uniref:hypothetical protein n=1 Tax=Streptomyces lincolnensis TaxID=1915 RepID=UPI001E49D3B0|nr:hypothetical protein [Streptomyces lincolnensis]MCD7440533.1 hypothetical protein [Streptomyces lincolnensis]